MISGWRGGSQEPTGVASSQPATSRSTRCPAPNTPWTTTHPAPCLPCPLDPRVQDVHSTHLARGHLYPLSPPLPSAPNLSTPPWSRLHPSLMAAQLHSHAPPPRHPCSKKLDISGPTAPPKLLHPPTRTATGLGHTRLIRAPQLALFHLPHQHQEPPRPTLPDTLTPKRSAFTTSQRKSLHTCTATCVPVLAWNVVHQHDFIKPDMRFLFFPGCDTEPGCSV